MKRFALYLAAVFTAMVLVIAACDRYLSDKSRPTEPEESNLYTYTQSQQSIANNQPQEFIGRAVKILQTKEPVAADIKWIESLDESQLMAVFDWMRTNLSVDSTRLKELNDALTGEPVVLSNCWGSWLHEFIEKQSGGGTGCYSDGFTNDWDHRCGNDWPPDKVYFFPCTNYNNRGSIRIWSSDWRSRIALGSGVDARVYQGCVQICVGYWSIYFSYTNPYTLMNTTYIYW